MISSNFESNDDTNKRIGLPYLSYMQFKRLSQARLRSPSTALFSNVRPILEYGFPATFPLTQGEATSLERVLRHRTRAMQELLCLPHIDRLRMYSLQYRRRRRHLIYPRHFISDKIGEDLQSFIAMHEILSSNKNCEIWIPVICVGSLNKQPCLTKFITTLLTFVLHLIHNMLTISLAELITL